MARSKCIGIRQTLTTLLPKAEIECGFRPKVTADSGRMLNTIAVRTGTVQEV